MVLLTNICEALYVFSVCLSLVTRNRKAGKSSYIPSCVYVLVVPIFPISIYSFELSQLFYFTMFLELYISICQKKCTTVPHILLLMHTFVFRIFIFIHGYKL